MNDGVISVEAVGDVSVIRLNRPEAKNSLTVPHIGELAATVRRLATGGSRCLMLTGSRGSFCAGRDLKEVDPDQEDPYEVLSQHINPLLVALRVVAFPTVAAVNGAALGLGLGLALSCDIVWAAENAVFGSPFRNLGCVSDSGGHFYLERLVGRQRTAELMFTGRLISGIEAGSLGLVSQVVPAPELEGRCLALCQSIAAGPTGAFRASKMILRRTRELEEVLELEAVSMRAAFKGVDAREGIRAFKEKRAPRFVGS
jgi:enoyl-CoA hydratase/carnithine racemase